MSIEVVLDDGAADHVAELFRRILGDRQWFSVLMVDLIVADQDEPRRRRPLRLEGLNTTEDIDSLKDSRVTAEEFLSLAGTVHSPNGDWELPMSVLPNRLILPERTNPEQLQSIKMRLQGYVAA